METPTRKQIAVQNFLQGYNCCQSFVLAFADLVEADADTLSRIACSFGGGISRLREVCGAVSGIAIIAGLLYGYPDAETGDRKADHYARVQQMARALEEKHGTIVCRELLGRVEKHDSAIPSARTPAYYESRPCAAVIGDAAEILDAYIASHPIRNR